MPNDDEAAALNGASSAPGADDRDAAAAPLGVLVVDDDHTLARLLADGLGVMGHSVAIAHSAAAAQDILRVRDDIGVVVSDIRMPGGDGLDLALDIAARLQGAHAVSVVLITGHATIDDVAKAVRTGAADFLRKPCRLSELTAAVNRGMARARQRRGDALRGATLDRRLAELEAERIALLDQLRDASRRLAALRDSKHLPRVEQDLLAVSHALRTPLNAIAGGASMLEARAAGDAAAANELALLRDGVAQAVTAIELVEELKRLEHAAPEEGPTERFALAGVLRRSVARLGDQAQAAGIGLIPPDPDGPFVRSRQDRVEHAADLCLGAALEAAAPGSVVELTCDRATAGGREWVWLTLLAGRRGLSVPMQLPDAPELPAGGTAHARTQETLRFFVARRIVEQLGGRLTSCSSPDGSFAIRLALPG